MHLARLSPKKPQIVRGAPDRDRGVSQQRDSVSDALAGL